MSHICDFRSTGPPRQRASAEKKQCMVVSTSVLLAPQLSIEICSQIGSLGKASFDCNASYLSLLKCALEGLGQPWAKTVLYVMVSSVVNAMSMYSKYVLGLAYVLSRTFRLVLNFGPSNRVQRSRTASDIMYLLSSYAVGCFLAVFKSYAKFGFKKGKYLIDFSPFWPNGPVEYLPVLSLCCVA